jgi:hypothetical protein
MNVCSLIVLEISIIMDYLPQITKLTEPQPAAEIFGRTTRPCSLVVSVKQLDPQFPEAAISLNSIAKAIIIGCV